MRKYIFVKVFLVFAFSYFFLSCDKTKVTSQKTEDNNQPSQIINDAHLLRSVNGIVDAELSSKKIEVYNTPDSSKMIFPQGVKVKFLNQDKTIKAVLTSLYAESLSNNLYYLKDSVVIVNYKDMDTIYCQDLYWIQDSAIVRTDLPLCRHSKGGIDYAKGLIASDDFESVEVKNPYGTQKVEEE